MPILKIDVDGIVSEVNVPMGKRLINALVDEAATDQLHACGGFARCTTCRVEFVIGEPSAMTQAEKDVLTAKGAIGQPGVRLSCQSLMEHDMQVKLISRLAGSGRADAGKRCGDDLAPPPVWTTR